MAESDAFIQREEHHVADRMLGGEERLKLLVWMAGAADADKSKISPQDRRHCIADLYSYLGDEGEADPTLRKASAGGFAVLTPAFKVAQRVLAAIADRREVEFKAGPPRPRMRLDGRQRPPIVYNDNKNTLPEKVLMLALEDVRVILKVARVKRCKDTAGCDEPGGRLFYQRRTDQEYCSRKCAARVAVRAHEARRKKAAKGAAR
jgi:hypothetical protein